MNSNGNEIFSFLFCSCVTGLDCAVLGLLNSLMSVEQMAEQNELLMQMQS